MKWPSIVEQLQAVGLTHAQNLGGSLLQWAHEGRRVYRDGREVQEVHPYDDKWGVLLDRQLGFRLRKARGVPSEDHGLSKMDRMRVKITRFMVDIGPEKWRGPTAPPTGRSQPGRAPLRKE
jgi:hypothetical protein